MNKKAVFLDFQSLAPEDLNLTSLWGLPDISWQCHDFSAAHETAARIGDAQIVLTNKVVLDEQLLRQNPQIELIIILATGTNNVDLAVADELGISVCNIVAYSTESVVQHTFSSILALNSRLLDYDRAVKEGQWSRSQFFGLLDYPIQELAGKTLGIIGYGAIGKRVRQVAEAFNMQVLVAESLVPDTQPDASRTPLTQVYQQSDIITLHSPLSQYSLNLIDDEAFAMMKASAMLINVGRGGIVNEQALANALKSGMISAAATDVLTVEPPPADHVLLDDSIPHLIVTPHTAWGSRQARQTLVQQVQQILQTLLQQKPLPNKVTGS